MAQVFFTLACLIAAGAVKYAEWHRKKGPGLQVAGIPVFLWLILAAVIFPCIHVARWAMDAFVTLLEAVAVRSGLTNVHYVLIGLSDALRFALLLTSSRIFASPLTMHLPNLVYLAVLPLATAPVAWLGFRVARLDARTCGGELRCTLLQVADQHVIPAAVPLEQSQQVFP